MKSLKDFILESHQTQTEILTNEVAQILKPFGNPKDGWKKDFDKDEIDDLMSREGWEYIGEEKDDKGTKIRYKWSKHDFECHIFVDNLKQKIFSFNIFS